MLGKIAVDEKDVFKKFNSTFKLKDKSVFEIGGALPEDSVVNAGVSKWVSVDPRNQANYKRPIYESYIDEAAKIDLPEKSFDYVFSCNAFEHIADLPSTLTKAKRLLKPTGVVYAHYGPIWSAPDGHHLDVEVDGKVLNFWEINVLPHWSHLVLSKQEMGELLSAKFSEEGVNKIVDAIYESNWLNRLAYEDYIRIFLDSGFKISHIETTHEVDYPYEHPDYGVSADVFQSKLEKVGLTKSNIQCRDMLVVLYN